MAENVVAAPVEDEAYVEDEFGIGLKIYLLARFIFCALCLLMVIGALVCLAVMKTTNMDILISSATALTPTKVDENFTGFQMCMYAQAAYSVLSPVVVLLFMLRRDKLFAYIDLALFAVFFIFSMVMGGYELLFNKSAWIFYLVLNPIWSFIALFVGKHFKYMPFSNNTISGKD